MGDVKITSLADIEKIEKVPFEDRITAKNTYDLMKQGAAVNPDTTAISFMLSGDQYATPMEVTYKELIEQITRTANLFYDLGVGPTDVVSYLLPNLPHTHYVLWGGEAAGIVNPINPMLEAHTIRDICQAVNTKVLVALTEMEGADIWQKVEAVRKDIPSLKAIVRVLGPSDEKGGIYGFDEVLPNYNADKLDSGRIIQSDDIASMYHTGGTTGTPKLAPHTHMNEVAMIEIMKTAGLFQTGDTLLCGLPLFHVNGTIVTGGFPLSVGGHIVILSPKGYRDISVMENFYKIVAHYKAAFFSCVPTVLSVLLNIPKEDADISSLRFALCGAAPLSVELMKRFQDHTDMKVLEGYGLTEGTTASSVNPAYGEQRVGSIGLRLPYTQMKVFNYGQNGAEEAEVNEIGSLCIKGPNVFAGYLEKSKNSDIWMKEGWFNTGDLGRVDEDGYFWLTGRQKDLIIRGGHNIDPAMIEEPLYMIPDIQVAAAVGRPDAHAGEIPTVFVQLKPGSKLTQEEIIDYLKKEVGEKAAIPKEVFIKDEIPLTPIGKIFKPALRWDAIKYVYEKDILALGEIVESVQVKVKEDSVHGTMADITLKPGANATADTVKEAVTAALAIYTVKMNINIV